MNVPGLASRSIVLMVMPVDNPVHMGRAIVSMLDDMHMLVAMFIAKGVFDNENCTYYHKT